MITLYGFKTIFPEGIGETKDLRAQWVLEESGLPYRVHGIDHVAGEHEGPAFSKLSPFHQVPVIEDDGFVVAESAAIAIATDAFGAADVMMAGMLRKSEAMKPFPNIQSYYERCFTRPAWERTLGMYAERLGVTVEQIR